MPKQCLKCGYLNDATDPRLLAQCPLCMDVYARYEASIAKKAQEAGLTIEDYADSLRREAERYSARVGFVGSTIVHTKNGLRRIDSLQAGDLVLTQAESEVGPTIHTRIARTAAMPADIKCSGYIDHPSFRAGTKFSWLFSTYAQPFWVKEHGWTPASQLKGDWLGPSPLLSLNGSLLYAHPNYVYKTSMDGVGWIGGASLEGDGCTWDFVKECFMRNEDFDTRTWPQDLAQRISGIPYVAVAHSIELEDHGSYFVGEHGLRVRHEQ